MKVLINYPVVDSEGLDNQGGFSHLKSNIDFAFKTDKSLISGTKIQVGSLLIDTSVSNKLKRLKQSMIEN